MKMKNGYWICYDCGKKEYGEPDPDNMGAITVVEGKCPLCGKNTTIIPRVDFLGLGD